MKQFAKKTFFHMSYERYKSQMGEKASPKLRAHPDLRAHEVAALVCLPTLPYTSLGPIKWQL